MLDSPGGRSRTPNDSQNLLLGMLVGLVVPFDAKPPQEVPEGGEEEDDRVAEDAQHRNLVIRSLPQTQMEIPSTVTIPLQLLPKWAPVGTRCEHWGVPRAAPPLPAPSAWARRVA